MSDKHAKQTAVRMKQAEDATELCFGAEITDDLVLSTEHASISKPILEAIHVSKAELRHDLDKICGRLNTGEDRISKVEDTSHSHGMQLSELRDLVRSLHYRADDAEDRQRRNNIWVVGLPEGAEEAKPVIFAEQFFKQLLSLEDLPPTYVVERAQRVPTGTRPLVPF